MATPRFRKKFIGRNRISWRATAGQGDDTAARSRFRTNFWWTIETEEPERVGAVKMKYQGVKLLADHESFSDERELMRWKNSEHVSSALSIQ